jgi:hypothetical protein
MKGCGTLVVCVIGILLCLVIILAVSGGGEEQAAAPVKKEESMTERWEREDAERAAGLVDGQTDVQMGTKLTEDQKLLADQIAAMQIDPLDILRLAEFKLKRDILQYPSSYKRVAYEVVNMGTLPRYANEPGFVRLWMVNLTYYAMNRSGEMQTSIMPLIVDPKTGNVVRADEVEGGI